MLRRSAPAVNVDAVAERLRRFSSAATGTSVESDELSRGTAELGTAEDTLRIVRLGQVEPFLSIEPNLLYCFTVPELSDQTVAILRGERQEGDGPYRGYRFAGKLSDRVLGAQRLQSYRAAQLVSIIYARCLDPVSFQSTISAKMTKAGVINVFARRLLGDRSRSDVENVAASLYDIRTLDQYQPGIGTSTARWMQHLAREALQAETLQSGPTSTAEKRDLRAALHTIQASMNAIDRFAALMQGNHSED